MRSIASIAALVLFGISAAPSPACLSFEPAEASLTGALVVRTYPGRPNYTSMALGDEPEQAYILLLDTPVCISADPNSELNSESFSGVTEIQIVASNLNLSSLLDQRINVTGSLFSAHTGHHKVPVLIKATRVRAA